ncbi:MAG: [FeFe] hydrogenase H-cluster maturation GTPase HydF [Rikenellaceae bacterium]
MYMNTTPNATRLHVAIFGRRNSGKSSLINAITGQDTSLVSAIAGTTTDAVAKAMELHGIGACLMIDTPGFDDEGELGAGRISRTLKSMEHADVALLLCEEGDLEAEAEWLKALRERETPTIAIVNKIDARSADEVAALSRLVEERLGLTPLLLSAKSGVDIEVIRGALLASLPADFTEQSITGDLVQRGDSVLLVMPQDKQAPKGRLILPQVQTLRELLDKGCIVSSCTTELLEQTLAGLCEPPKLIITDSQIFKYVHERCPSQSRLTSFSVLMAGYKGDVKSFVAGAAAIDSLTARSRVLIAEACTHAPLSEDIGREKLPRMLRARVGESLAVDIVAGRQYPADLTPYDLVIHCGACMFNRKYMMWRVDAALRQGVPITNYGVAIAHLSGILSEVVY